MSGLLLWPPCRLLWGGGPPVTSDIPPPSWSEYRVPAVVVSMGAGAGGLGQAGGPFQLLLGGVHEQEECEGMGEYSQFYDMSFCRHIYRMSIISSASQEKYFNDLQDATNCLIYVEESACS